MNKDDIQNKTAKGLLTMSASSGIVFLIQFISTLVLARIFTPANFGIISAITIVTSYTDIFCRLGIGPAIIQKSKLNQDDISTGFTTSVAFGMIATVIIVTSSTYLADLINIEEVLCIKIIATSFFINSFSVVPLSLIQREMKFNKIILIDVISNLGYLLMAIFLGLCGLGVWALILALLTKYIVSTLISLLYCPNKISFGFNKVSFKQLVYFGGGYTLSSIFSVTANQGDYIVITRTMGEHFLGIYSKAYQLIAVPANLLGHVMDLVLFPAMSIIQNDNYRLERIFTLATATLAIIYFPIGAAIYLYSEEIVLLMLGIQWIETASPLRILSLSMFFRVGYKISDPLIRAKGVVYNRAAIQIIYAIMVLAFSFIGSHWGLNGIAIGVAIALVMNYVMITIKTHMLIKFKLCSYFRCILPIMILTIALILVMVYMKVQFELLFSNFISLFFSIILLIILVIASIAVVYYIFWPRHLRKQFFDMVMLLFENVVR